MLSIVQKIRISLGPSSNQKAAACAFHSTRGQKVANFMRDREAVNFMCDREAVNFMCDREAVNFMCDREAVNIHASKFCLTVCRKLFPASDIRIPASQGAEVKKLPVLSKGNGKRLIHVHAADGVTNQKARPLRFLRFFCSFWRLLRRRRLTM